MMSVKKLVVRKVFVLTTKLSFEHNVCISNERVFMTLAHYSPEEIREYRKEREAAYNEVDFLHFWRGYYDPSYAFDLYKNSLHYSEDEVNECLLTLEQFELAHEYAKLNEEDTEN